MKYFEKIRSLREDNDLSQTQVASILNVGQKTYSDYEMGKIRIPLESVIVLAQYYNVNMDYICGISNIKTQYPAE